MPKPRGTFNVAGTRAGLDTLQVAVHREVEGAEADPFDDAMLSAVAGVAEALKAEAGALADLEAMGRKAARQV